MKQCAEICSIGEVLTLATGHVNYLDDFINIQGIERAADVLDIVGSKCIVAVLTVQTKETHMMPYGGLRVKLIHSIIKDEVLTISLRAWYLSVGLSYTWWVVIDLAAVLARL